MQLENTEEIASHVLLFLIRGIINPFKFSLANFATTNVTAVQLFSLFWKAVGILERKCFLRVIVATCDGASSNHKFFDMHRYFESNASTTGIIHKVQNSFASTRYLYFFSDPPHLLKTTRNAFYKSRSPCGKRYMWNNGLHILWSHFSQFYFQDLDMGLHLLPKITRDRVVLNSYSKMNVRTQYHRLFVHMVHLNFLRLHSFVE